MQHCKFGAGICVAPIVPSPTYSQSSALTDWHLAAAKSFTSMRRISFLSFVQNMAFVFPGKGVSSSQCIASPPSIQHLRKGKCLLIRKLSTMASVSEASSSTMQPVECETSKSKDDVEMISTLKDFESTLASAKDKLVVIEYAASHSINSRKIYPAMVELSRTCPDVIFRLIMGDESDETKELCERAGVEKVPHFIFYKNMEKIHEEEGIDADLLLGDVLYYGDTDAPIQQLHSRKDVEALLERHSEDHKLVVLDVGLKHCGPCVKVYPTVVKLARKMADTTVFARMHGDESDACMDFLREMSVVEVPTFLFIRDGKVCGRYVGSGRGELIGEILRYQGVRVTY